MDVLKMDFKYEKELNTLLSPIFEELEFKKQEEDIYLKEGYAAKVAYDKDAAQLLLLGAKPKEGENLEFITLSSWLFDDTHTEKDLKAVAIDFEETLREELGAKKQRAAKKIAMPGKAAAGESQTIESFTKVFLDMYPKYRNAYKDMMAEYDSFLFVDFYSKYGVEVMRELCSDAEENERKLNKFLSFLNKQYTEGDRTVAAVVTSVIFAGAFYNDRKTFDDVVFPKLADMNYLSKAAATSVERAAKDKKLQQIFTSPIIAE